MRIEAQPLGLAVSETSARADVESGMSKRYSEPALSRIGLGCSRIGSFNNPRSLADSRRLVEHALAQGVTTIDTANIYGQGDSEIVIGRAMGSRRDQAFLVTKTGQTFSAKMRLMRPLKPLLRPFLDRTGDRGTVTARRAGEMRSDWRPQSYAPSLEASLRRLRTDRVDGFLLHGPPPSVILDPAVAEALMALKAAGKARHYGVSCDDAAMLEAAVVMPGLGLLQLPYSLIETMSAAISDAIFSRGIIVLAREVIRLQPERSVADALRASVSRAEVACTLIGTTSSAHLGAAIREVGLD